MTIKICANCQKEVIIKNSWRLHQGAKNYFCSHSCSNKFNNSKRKLGVYKKCPICNTQFYKHKSNPNKQFCSKKCSYKNREGKAPQNTSGLSLGRGWNKGKHLSLDHKLSLRKAHIGKPILAIRGANHHNWKNGATKESRIARLRVEYKNWRRAIFERDNHTCVFCHQRGGLLQADHIKPFAKYPKLRYVVSNGRTLCFECHKQTPTFPKNLRKKAHYKVWDTGKQEINCKYYQDYLSL